AGCGGPALRGQMDRIESGPMARVCTMFMVTKKEKEESVRNRIERILALLADHKVTAPSLVVYAQRYTIDVSKIDDDKHTVIVKGPDDSESFYGGSSEYNAVQHVIERCGHARAEEAVGAWVERLPKYSIGDTVPYREIYMSTCKHRTEKRLD